MYIFFTQGIKVMHNFTFQISISSCGWFEQEEAQRKEATSKSGIIIPLLESLGWIRKDLQYCSTVLCIRCVTIDLVKSTQKEVRNQALYNFYENKKKKSVTNQQRRDHVERRVLKYKQHKIMERKVKLLPKIEEVRVGQAHKNTRKLK